MARLARGATDDVLKVADTGGLIWGRTDMVGRGGGQCWLGIANPSSLILGSQKGNQIWVDGRARTIPDAGVTLAVTGLTPDTTYYVYAAWVSSSLALEASTTGHQYTTGLRHKTGDESRTLVGMCRVYAGPSFVYTEKQRGVHSYFNQSPLTASGFLSAHASITSSTFVEVHPSINCEFLSWANIATQLSITGVVQNLAGTAGVALDSFIGIDGVPVGGLSLQTLEATFANIATSRSYTIGEGHHTLTLLAKVSGAGAVATYQGDAAGQACCRTHALIEPWI